MSYAERREAILEVLCIRRHDTYRNLAFEFQVSRETIRQDIAVLMCSYPIETVRGRYGGGVKIADGFYLYRKKLTARQAALLVKLSAQLTALRADGKSYIGAADTSRLRPFSFIEEEQTMTIQDTANNQPDTALVDIRNISVDQSLTREERVAEFLRQIKNPCHFKCGKFTVRAQFAENGVSLEDCLKQILI